MTEIAELLDALDLAVAGADGIAPPAVLERSRARARELRARWGLLTDTVVVALAGGTGSGKSSLMNAIAGAPIASVSPFRPHTDEAMAWADLGDPAVRAILDELGIERRVANDTMPSLALVDLPDMDSVVSWHRAIVTDVLPRVDVVCWVTDPVKYADPAMHRDFLAPVAGYEDQVVVVLNKADLVEDGVAEVKDHLEELLRSDGFRSPEVVEVSAMTGKGVDDLVARLGDRRDVKALVSDRLLGEIGETAAAMSRSIGTWETTELLGPGPGTATERVDEGWERLRRSADPMTRSVVDRADDGESRAAEVVLDHLMRRADLGARLAWLRIEAENERRRRRA